MFNLREESYFTAGLVGALFALYAASMFTYFKNTEAPAMVSQTSASVETMQVSDTSTKAVIANSEQLASIMEKSQVGDIFSPISHSGEVSIPGAICNLTENNISYSHDFSNLPQDCSRELRE